VNAGTQEVLGTAKAADLGIEVMPEFAQVVRRAVGEGAIGLRPDILGRVEFGGVRRELVDVEARVDGQEGPHLPAAMEGAAIPEQVHRAPQVSKQMLQEGPDVEAREGVRSTSQIPGQPPASRRNR
jgi:hypothetical protein